MHTQSSPSHWPVSRDSAAPRPLRRRTASQRACLIIIGASPLHVHVSTSHVDLCFSQATIGVYRSTILQFCMRFPWVTTMGGFFLYSTESAAIYRWNNFIILPCRMFRFIRALPYICLIPSRSLAGKDRSFQVVSRSPCLGRGSPTSRVLQYDLMPIADSCYCHRWRPRPLHYVVVLIPTPTSITVQKCLLHCPLAGTKEPCSWQCVMMLMSYVSCIVYHVCDLTPFFVFNTQVIPRIFHFHFVRCLHSSGTLLVLFWYMV